MSLERIVGHSEVRKQLEQMKGRVPPSLLFAGPQGIGKKLVAMEFARDLTGETRALDLNQSMAQTESLFFVSPDGASIKIEQVRDVLQFVGLAREGKPLVVIFDQAHLINPQAANALLKSVEEPPPGVQFFFLTPSPALLLQTIRSRSQVVRFAPLSDADVLSVLKTRDPELAALAEADGGWAIEMASGSPGHAIEILRGGESATDVPPVIERLVMACGPQGSSAGRTEALAALREALKERELHAMGLRFLVRLFATSWRQKNGLGRKGSVKSPTGWLANLSFDELDRATDLALEAEIDLSRNVDRQLLWEAFASRLARFSDKRAAP